MKTYNILVTGIGGDVGQGILRNIISLDGSYRLIGANISSFSAGNHLCDKVYLVGYAYDKEYIGQIQKICKEEQIDLIIPSTDYEVYYLSKQRDKLPKLAASSAATNYIFLNKYRTYEVFKKHDIPFADTCLPSEFQENWLEYIIKPKEGRGSRGIQINPKNVRDFDETYMVQKLEKGIEITTAIYVNLQNELTGHITLDRELRNGYTSECKVTTLYDQKLTEIINKIKTVLSIQGCFNIQSIVNEKGEIIPFEINGRISGTNSIRSNFGFEDVKYTVEENLLNKKPEKPSIIKGMATRILMDVIYPENTEGSDLITKNTTHHIF